MLKTCLKLTKVVGSGVAAAGLIAMGSLGSVASASPVGISVTTTTTTSSTSTSATPTSSSWVLSSSNIGQVSKTSGAKIWSNGSATTYWNGSGRIALYAKADACDGYPKVKLTIDGKVAGEYAITNTTGSYGYSPNTMLSSGKHKVVVSFANDFGRSGCDRNVYLFSVGSYVDKGNLYNQLPQYVNPYYTKIMREAAAKTSDSFGKRALNALSVRSTGVWLGSWLPRGQVGPYVKSVVTDAAKKNQIPTFVIYGMNGCLGKSGGISERDYDAWIGEIAYNLGSVRTAVVLEPDALAFAGNSCSRNLPKLSSAVDTLAYHKATVTYIDAGHSNWLPVSTTVDRLRKVGVSKVRGFSLNVSNSHGEAENRAFGNSIAKTLNSHFIIDTSRSGKPMDGKCNPIGAVLGSLPKAYPYGLQDAAVWVKVPGESDGTCHGGPAAGTLWSSYAISLVKLAGWKV